MTGAARFTVEEITRNFSNGVSVEFVAAYRYDELLCQVATTEADVQGLVEALDSMIHLVDGTGLMESDEYDLARETLSKFRGES